MGGSKRVFILGGTGFIGSAVVRNLSCRPGDYILRLITHTKLPGRELEQTDTWESDLASLPLALIDDFNPEAIIHMARMGGRNMPGRYFAAVRGAVANNRILHHLVKTQVNTRIVYISGTLVYGDCGDKQVTEESKVRPASFTRQYLIAEKPWMRALETGSLPVMILRPPWIMGGSSWFAAFYINYMPRNKGVPRFGSGENLMTFLDIDDCAGLIVHALEHGKPGRYYNLFAPGACITQIEFASILSEITGLPVHKLSRRHTGRVYGRTLMEALTFSARISTMYPEFLAGYRFRFPAIDGMIYKNLPEDLLRRG